MKRYLLITMLAMYGAAVAKDVYVQGHYRKDGAYVEPHHRTSPDRNQYNNYGTQGNYNPYTGREGRIEPQPSYGGYQQPRRERCVKDFYGNCN